MTADTIATQRLSKITQRLSMNANAQTLFEWVREWGQQKGITGPDGCGTITGQLGKLQEEIGELIEAINKGDEAGMIDGLGDSQVVLILLADLLGFRAEDCLQSAYEVIAKRTGKMVNGTFVKDAP